MDDKEYLIEYYFTAWADEREKRYKELGKAERVFRIQLTINVILGSALIALLLSVIFGG